MTTLAGRLFEAIVRVEMMFWIPGLQASIPSEFKDFFRNDLEDSKELHQQIPWLKKASVDFEDYPDEFPTEFFRKGLHGYLVNLARPIPNTFSADGRSHQYSWGHYQCRWVYCDTLDELADRAEAFSKEVVERERVKPIKSKRQKARA